ncbi:MAG: hypothetical protein ACHQTE_01130 [Candidatus Saccharimonadales bacterium]
MDWAQILVIILSVFLAIFLLVGIILILLLIKVTRQIKTISGSASRTVLGIEKLVSGIGNVTSPLFLMRLISKQLKKYKK